MLDEESFRLIMGNRLPFAQMLGLQVDYFAGDHVRLRAVFSERFLRPGGTIAGPVMMGLADAALYALVLSRIGPVELAVTTSLSINFLRKPEPADVIAEARMLKLGKRLAVGEVTLFSERPGVGDPVAHVTGTYSIPPPEDRAAQSHQV
ncbi:MAG: PaaI family thioesterase [Granulosicoccus sp.]|nr:PaaI family thioesterase [Granulosicoccus sp.]